MKKRMRHFLLGVVFLVLSTIPAHAQWTKTNGPLSGNINALAVNGSTIFAGTAVGVFLSTDNGTTWTEADSNLKNSDIHAFAVSGGAVFAGSWGGGVFLSTNNGTSWTAVNSGLPPNSYVAALGVNNSTTVAGIWDYAQHIFRVFLSADNGTNWTSADFGLANKNVQSLAINGSAIFAGTDKEGVFLSTDNGTSWNADNSGLTGANVLSLATSGGAVFAGTFGNGVFTSAQNEKTWTAINSGLTNAYIRSLVVSGNKIFAGTDNGGVFLSTNSGASWTAVNSDFTNAMVHTLAVSGNTILAGTWGEGVWRMPLSEMTGELDSPKRQGTHERAQLKIYSSGRTGPAVAMDFSLPHSDQVAVGIYDMSGHEITSLVNGHLGSGAYSLSWDARNAAVGVYAVKMRAGGDAFVKSIRVFR